MINMDPEPTDVNVPADAPVEPIVEAPVADAPVEETAQLGV